MNSPSQDAFDRTWTEANQNTVKGFQPQDVWMRRPEHMQAFQRTMTSIGGKCTQLCSTTQNIEDGI